MSSLHNVIGGPPGYSTALGVGLGRQVQAFYNSAEFTAIMGNLSQVQEVSALRCSQRKNRSNAVNYEEILFIFNNNSECYYSELFCISLRVCSCRE